MPFEVRIAFSILITIVFMLASYPLRPSQTVPVSPRRFRLRERDPFFFLLFKPDGLPKPHAWAIPMAVNGVAIVVIWSLA